MKIRKLLSVFLAMLVAFSVIPMAVFAANTSVLTKLIGNADYLYKIHYDDDTVEIMSCHLIIDDSAEYSTELEIPSEILGYPVTAIGEHAFLNNDEFTSITLPDTVTVVARAAFEGCRKLESVTLSSSLTEIREGVFKNCKNLESVIIPEGVKVIGYDAFKGCSFLSEVTLPDTLIRIGDGAFVDCAFASVTIPENVEIIGFQAFSGCEKLGSVTVLSDNLKTVYYNAFYNTPYMDDESTWTDGAMYINNCLVMVDEAYLDKNAVDQFRIKDGTTSVSMYAFEGCRTLTTIFVPVSVTWIGNYAFKGCRALETIKYDGSREMWYNEVFLGIDYSEAKYVFADSDEGFILGYMYGDVDGNGVVNLIDILRAKKYVAGFIGKNEVNLVNGDLDYKGDGITATDIVLLKRLVAAM